MPPHAVVLARSRFSEMLRLRWSRFINTAKDAALGSAGGKDSDSIFSSCLYRYLAGLDDFFCGFSWVSATLIDYYLM